MNNIDIAKFRMLTALQKDSAAQTTTLLNETLFFIEDIINRNPEDKANNTILYSLSSIICSILGYWELVEEYQTVYLRTSSRNPYIEFATTYWIFHKWENYKAQTISNILLSYAFDHAVLSLESFKDYLVNSQQSLTIPDINLLYFLLSSTMSVSTDIHGGKRVSWIILHEGCPSFSSVDIPSFIIMIKKAILYIKDAKLRS